MMGIESPAPSEQEGQMLRHTLATLAYRGGKTLRGAPEGFPDFARRHPRELRARFLLTSEICSIGRYRLHRENRSAPTPSCSPGKWIRKGSSQRLRPSMRTWLRANHSGPGGKLFQGPIADALTHVGQIAILRRMADAPVRAENYFRAEIVAGRVGPDQAAPKREFD